MELPALSENESRILGCLIEKDLTTPEYYPLSLNALVNACNQINNRHPVLTLGESEVKSALESLRDQRLAAVISGGDNRVMKYAHKAGEALELPRPELSLMCELLLRGPQTPGELRSRANRMHAFADLPDVQATLSRLATRAPALVVLLPRQPGSRESRYAHLLGGPVIVAGVGDPGSEASPASPGSPRLVSAQPRGIAAPPSSDATRLAQLEADVAALKAELAELRAKFSS